jgi:hypothetical protein
MVPAVRDMLRMLQPVPAGMGQRRSGFYSMRARHAVCAPHNRHRSVVVIVIMIMVMIVSVLVMAVVVMHHDAPAVVHRHDAATERQGAQQDTESDKSGGNESAHGMLLGSLSGIEE